MSQTASEDDTDYHVRVEQLSRDAGFGDADALRRHYSLVPAINGPRDTNLREELVAKRGTDFAWPDQWQGMQ